MEDNDYIRGMIESIPDALIEIMRKMAEEENLPFADWFVLMMQHEEKFIKNRKDIRTFFELN